MGRSSRVACVEFALDLPIMGRPIYSTMTALEASAPPGSDRHFTVGVTGMTCAACASRIEKVLRRVPGVAAANVNLATEIAQVDGDARVTSAAIEAAIAKAGYGTRPVDHGGAPEDQGKLRRELLSILVGAVLTLPLIAPMVADLAGRHLMLPAWWQLALAAPVQFWLGAPFYHGAWKALRGGTANMDVLVALGTSAAFGLSLYLMLGGEHSSLFRIGGGHHRAGAPRQMAGGARQAPHPEGAGSARIPAPDRGPGAARRPGR